MNERIRKLRRTLDLTQAVFAEKIGMKQNSIALVEGGKRNISDYAIRVICRESMSMKNGFAREMEKCSTQRQTLS